RLDLADNLPPIYADPAQLRQVVMNLVINASEAIGEKSGAITIRTGVMHADEAYLRTTFVPEEKIKPGRYVFLEVSDTGSGMDAATMARIFEPFFTTKFTGRGLGLSAVLGIVRAHHGAIKVYSEPGKGTTVKVLFPVMEKEDPTGEGERAAKRGSGLVLVVDDEESVREVAAIVLEEAGFKVLTAANGEEAVALMRAHAKEVIGVVLDLTMPGMDGGETLSALRRIREDVPVILSSGYNEEMAAARFAGKRLAGFLQKPYRPTELVGVALTAFGGARER
ncbi:MAG: response regulator, partial [Zetaproteobacteria bacterium]